MGKNKSKKPTTRVPSEWNIKHLFHPNVYAMITPIVDTHMHLLTTFSAYKRAYPDGEYDNVWDFVRGLYVDRGYVKALVDVWCEAPVQNAWKEVADSAVHPRDRKELWGGIEYWFVMGVHPHNAKLYNDAVERTLLEAMNHPRCVGWGEIGLDYHYDNSPRDVQQDVFTRQLRAAVRLRKPLTIHTREAEADTERILKEEVPVDHKIHLHCFTDSPEFALRLLAHFPNLYIGITGVITYSTNHNTSALVRQMIQGSASASSSGSIPPTAETVAKGGGLAGVGSGPGTGISMGTGTGTTSSTVPGPRFLLETDAPFMVPSNLYPWVAFEGRFPFSHSAMIPWTADFVAGSLGDEWEVRRVMEKANENAQVIYGKLFLTDLESALAETTAMRRSKWKGKGREKEKSSRVRQADASGSTGEHGIIQTNTRDES